MSGDSIRPVTTSRRSTAEPGSASVGSAAAAAHELGQAICALPAEWHGSGSIGPRVVEALARHLQARLPRLSVETGTGRSTLLFSQLSARHLVFTKEDDGDGDSLAAVRSCELLDADNVEFVIGPTQRTLLSYAFAQPIDFAYLDGPHAYPFPDLEYWAVYPHIPAGGLLVIDDVQIPTIANLFDVLCSDTMWKLIEVVDTTAFFRRTAAEGIDPYGEGWWLQDYNTQRSLRHLPLRRRIAERGWTSYEMHAPAAVKSTIRQLRQMLADRVRPR